MARRSKSPERRDAQLSPGEKETAVRKIDRRLAELRQFDISSINDRGDARLKALSKSLEGLLIDIFGSDTSQYGSYRTITYLDHAGMNALHGTPIHEVREGFQSGIDQAVAVLETIKKGFVEDLEDAGLGISSAPLKAYETLDLHPEIDRQVSGLFNDGHYAEAIEKSVKVLNNLVRMRSDVEEDGTSLMMKVFSKTNPVLKFNDLADQSDLDEQQGFMYLFAGAVMGLRNPRAHKLFQDEPERALEFIAMISLLAKLLDETTV